ncbi:triacylglycerol lipase, partial [Haematococcus lacustris]
EAYNQSSPPEYRLGDIPPTMRLALFTGGQDRLADPLDVEFLIEALPPGVVVARQHDPDLEHLDYIWAQDARPRVYLPLLRLLRAHLPGATPAA